MDRVKGIAKNGYHPTGKDGGKESWRGEHKGINQVVSPPLPRTLLDLQPKLIYIDTSPGQIGRKREKSQ